MGFQDKCLPKVNKRKVLVKPDFIGVTYVWSKNRNHKAQISHMIAVSKEKNRTDRKRTLEYAKAKLRTDTLTPKIYNQVSLVLML